MTSQSQVPTFVAHTPGPDGSWHSLVDHLVGTAARARRFGDEFGAGPLASLCGLWHDIGKADPRFREYLIAANEGRPVSSPGMGHAAAGALLAANRKIPVVGTIVAGHHAGLPSTSHLKETIAKAGLDKGSVAAVVHYDEIKELEFAGSNEELLPIWLNAPSSVPTFLRTELLTRMVFSSLIDADRLDTAAHFAPDVEAQRTKAPELSVLLERLHNRRSGMLADRANDPVSATRSAIRHEVVTRLSSSPVGLYTLTSPTGSGKTVTVLEAALEHAVRHGLERVVMAVPYTSVTEQVADVSRRLVDEDGDAVLEHHSAMGQPSEGPHSDGQRPSEIRRRLATENWDASLVVTTTVRLLESLFSDRPSECRRLHRLSNAVIIIDETQSVPLKLVDPAIRMLSQLVEDFGTTVVLMTATQPPFARLPSMRAIADPVELLMPSSTTETAFRRCALDVMPGQPSWEEVADEVSRRLVETGGRGLVVVNTIADAERLFEQLQHLGGAALLTTRLCGAHRRDVLCAVRSRLDRGDATLLISTQLIEAGVDIDFPLAFRAVAPVTSIAQVAGRVNRHGQFDGEASLVVFDPRDGKCPPDEYATGSQITRSLLADGVDLLTQSALQMYFDRLYAALHTKLTEQAIEPVRLKHNFPEVAKRFRLIETDTESVIVPYGDFDVSKFARTYEALRWNRTILDQLQPYTVSLRRHTYDQAQSDGMLESSARLPIPVWVAGYDDRTGLMLHDNSKAEIW